MSETIYYPTATTLVNSDATVTANGTIYQYLTSQGAYLTPSPSNAAVIIQWMKSVVNNYTISPFGSNLYLYSNISLSFTPGAYYGALLAPDGRVIYTPGGSGNVGIFNPNTNSFTTILVGAVGSGLPWLSGCVLPDGRIAWCPEGGVAGRGVGIFNSASGVFTSTNGSVTATDTYGWGCLTSDGRMVVPADGPSTAANIGVFNPATNSFTTYAAGQAGLSTSGGIPYKGACTVPDGRTVFTPYGGANVGVFDQNTNSYTTYAYNQAGLAETASQFTGSALVPDGRVIFTPLNASCVGTFNPSNNSFTSYPHGFGTNQNLCNNCCLLPTGEVLMPGFSKTFVGIFSPNTNTFRTIPTPVNFGVAQPIVLQDGRVCIAPTQGTNYSILLGLNKPVPREFCTHPFFNRCS